MNVFEHQKFLVRTRDPDGEDRQMRLSWREIMTGGVNANRFDYPLEYMNVAAVELCAALTQAVLEPEGIEDLTVRLETPLTESEVEAAITDYRDAFGYDGETRFLQGSEPTRDKKGRYTGVGDLSELLLTVKKGDKEFLNRPIRDWGVQLDQIPLLLFSRMTFYEKSAGRGYLTGTSGDLEIRTHPVRHRSLRETIWLNVLTREHQESSFIEAGSTKGYDGWMWERYPEDGEVARRKISLRSGLFWMVASAWVVLEELGHPHICIVTGERIEVGTRAGTGVIVSPTGIRYGVNPDPDDKNSRTDSFFLHPAAPHKHIEPEKKPPFDTHWAIEESAGLIGSIGGLFFAQGRKGERSVTTYPAPLVAQLIDLDDSARNEAFEEPPRTDLLCFGFHMLSSKKNVHGAYAHEYYRYPLLGLDPESRERALKVAEELMMECAKTAREIERALRAGIQRCTLAHTNQKNENGRISFSSKDWLTTNGMMRDASEELWLTAATHLHTVLRAIQNHSHDHDGLIDASGTILANWEDRLARTAETIFLRYFNSYSPSPTHMAAAHDAKQLFYSMIGSSTGFLNRRKEKRKEIAHNTQEVTHEG